VISIDLKKFNHVFLINGNSFLSNDITERNLIISPLDHYLIINNGKDPLEIEYNKDISLHQVIFDPYKFEKSEKLNFTPELFIKKYEIHTDYIDTLPKWYSFKFTYSDYNLIFVRPGCGLSIQIHRIRDEFWEILSGRPIILNGNKVFYNVEAGTKFKTQVNAYHSVINSNEDLDEFVIVKERWEGDFDENDIERIFNPNHYY
jgi:mannose-6-phosphate isomerase-like protein (cupin superfamily)